MAESDSCPIPDIQTPRGAEVQDGPAKVSHELDCGVLAPAYARVHERVRESERWLCAWAHVHVRLRLRL